MSIRNVKSECTGCTACYNLCNKGAIQMKTNDEGFKYPIVDSDLCNECGLCEKKCPVLNDAKKEENVKSFGVKSYYNVMGKSTSAGVFALMAKYILSKDGYVSGAVYDDSFRVKHIVSNQLQDVERMRKSKYVQSDLGDVFYEIKQILDNGNLVLFSGTPCQVEGLLAFLGDRYSNLYTVDLFCYGVPSPKSWEKYLVENIDLENLKSVDMRYKGDFGWRKTCIAFEYNDGTSLVCPSNKNWYTTHFSKGIGFRKSCYMCKFSKFPKRGDITIGDWWGAAQTDSNAIDSDRGISTVIVNNSKGMSLFSAISEQFTYCNEITLEQAIADNCKTNRNKINPLREKFFEALEENQFNRAVKKTINPFYDVIILGCTLNTNYGAAITYYALYKYVTSIGLTCAISCSDYANRNDYSVNFFKKNTVLAPPKRRTEYRDYCDMTNTFLLGSDQVWNYKLFEKSFGKMFYFDFVDDSIKKVAYAGSFGYDYVSLFEKAPDKFYEIKKLFEKIDYISVREKSGTKVLKENFDLESNWVLDPVFLVEKDIYDRMAAQATKKYEGEKLVSYFVHASDDYNNVLTDISQELNLSMINMITGHPDRFESQRERSVEPICTDLTLEEWVYNFKNATYVVTNSFHGLCMALIFKRNFIIIKNEPLSRVTSVLELLGLEDRLVDNYEDYVNKKYLLSKSIDWDYVTKKLESEKKKSQEWLTTALYSDKLVYSYNISTNVVGKKIKLIDSWKPYFHSVIQDDDLVLFVVSFGKNNGNPELLKQIKQECMMFEGDIVSNNSENLLAVDTVYAKGNGNNNCRTRGIGFTERGLDLIMRPHKLFALSFDYELRGKGGKFKLQLDGSPWQTLTESIFVSPNNRKGHYEGCIMTTNNVNKFEGNSIQIRTDEMVGGVVLTNLKLEEGKYATKSVNCTSNTENGLTLILDKSSHYLNVSEVSTGVVQYLKYGINIEYNKLSSKDLCSAHICISNNDSTREIYEFTKQGIYLGTFSKKKHKIVDIAFLDNGRALNRIW